MSLGGVWMAEETWRESVQRLHRQAVVTAAETFVMIVDGRPVRFTPEEARRLAFLHWRLYGDQSRKQESGVSRG